MTDREQVIEVVIAVMRDFRNRRLKYVVDGKLKSTDEDLPPELTREAEATVALTAVLDATKEPTEEMVYMGSQKVIGSALMPKEPMAKNCWRAMHAALRRNLTGGDDGEGE